jgi:hypothetical protein
MRVAGGRICCRRLQEPPGEGGEGGPWGRSKRPTGLDEVATWGRKSLNLLAEPGEGGRRGKKAADGWSRWRPAEEMASGGGGGSGGDRDGSG